MVDRQDLLKLYGMVVTYYENHLVAGAGLMLWGDLQVLMDSQEGGKGSFVWNHQSLWQIRSWRLYTLSNVHVLETVSGEVLYMFADVSYPLSVKLMERMLKHKLEIDKDVVGNDMTTAEQLIRFIKNQIAAAQFNKATKTANYMVLEGVLMKNKDAASSRDIQLICAEFSSIQVKTQADWMLLQSSYFNPQVPTGRVVVPTGRYVVPAGKVIIIVSPGRLSLVPTGRVLSPGSDNESDDASVHSEATIAQQQQNIQPQIITTVSNNNAKFPYLKKDEYEVWAMKMEYWITNNDMNIWKVIQNGNSLKRTGRDRDGRVIILPPTTADEHIAVQRESKARTTLLQSIPDDHVADFHYMDDARDIWNAVKARFGGNAESKKMRKSMLKQEFSEFRIIEAEGLDKGYDRMQKILSQLNQLKAKPEDEDINLKFLRALPLSWSQVVSSLFLFLSSHFISQFF
ncbi:hypothetical protein Tco_0674876 [Tanacetum coccineum]